MEALVGLVGLGAFLTIIGISIFFAILPILSFVKLCQIKNALYDIADMTSMQLNNKKQENSTNGEANK